MNYSVQSIELSESQKAVLQKYQLEGETGWEDVCKRVAKFVAGAEKTPELQAEWEQKFLSILLPMKFVPGGSILANSNHGTFGLCNCLQGDTLVHTKDFGLVPIKKLQGLVEVLSAGGEYRTANFGSFGVQPLYRVELENGQIFEATPEHYWITGFESKGGRFERIQTKDLEGCFLMLCPSKERPAKNDDYFAGVRHGIVYGDGSKNGAASTYSVRLFGTKRSLSQYFAGTASSIYERSYNSRNFIHVEGLRGDLKAMPDLSASDSYWYGFFSGLLATDGGVDNRGSTGIYQSNEADLEVLSQNMYRFGMAPTGVRIFATESNFVEDRKPGYRLGIIKQSLIAEDFIREDQRQVFVESGIGKGSRNAYIKVKSVTDLERSEEVFCCIEPETHTFVIEGGILTSNCFVLAAEDDIQSIVKLVSDAILTTKFRGGVGINIGSKGMPGYIRPKGSPFKDGQALGPCAVLDMVSDCANKITTGNKARRGAFMFSMHWKHPDIWEFIQAKTQSVIDASLLKSAVKGDLSQQDFDKAWVETHLSPEGKRYRRWHNANISVQVDSEFFKLLDEYDSLPVMAVTDEHIQVKRLWDTIAQFAHDTADPGLIIWDNMQNRSPIGKFLRTTNPLTLAA